MPILQYETRVSPDGTIAIPPIPEYRDRKVVVRVHEDEKTEEQRKTAGQKFFDTWDGLLEGMPDRIAKEIRAERLERKYGNKNDNSTD